MAISEVPAKIVESAANLTGKKMEIARDLFKLAYEKQIPTMEIEEMVQKYKEVFDLMKDVSPPEKTTHFFKTHKVFFHLGVALVTFIAMICLSFFCHHYWERLTDVLMKTFY